VAVSFLLLHGYDRRWKPSRNSFRKIFRNGVQVTIGKTLNWDVVESGVLVRGNFDDIPKERGLASELK